MRLFSVKDIHKHFGPIQALRGVSLICRSGEILGLVGANGSGKTTLSRIMAGVLRPDSGKIYLDEQPVSFHHPLEARKRGVVMAHQNLSLVGCLSVWENVMLDHEVLTSRGFLQNQQTIAQALVYLRRVGFDKDPETKVDALPPDEQQLVEIAKALSWNPYLLILDEPTASLSYDKAQKLFQVLHEEREKGKMVVFISHRIEEVLSLCNRVVVLRNGTVVGNLETQSSDCNIEGIVALMTGNGQKRETCSPDYNLATNRILLEVRSLRVERKVQEISFELHEGEILGLGGLQGQGQEEVLLSIFGAIPRTGGTILLNGRETSFRHPVQAISQGIVLVPGDRLTEGLFLEKSILFNTIYPQLNTFKTEKFIPYRKYRQMTQEIVKRIQLVYGHLHQEVRFLSGGNQQKVVIGKWLSLNPKIILLNDPTKGVDVGARREIYQLVQRLRREGAGVILFASDNQELLENADRVLVMYNGTVVDVIKREELCESRLLASSLCVFRGGKNDVPVQ